MQGGLHHQTLEEIGRLEAERARLDERIRALRATLPKPEVEKANPVTGLTPAQAAPIAVLVAASPTVPPKPVDPSITDHAVLRYLERHYGFDFETVRTGLLSETVKLAARMGAKSVKSDGGKLILQGARVVTFVPNRNDKVRRGKPKHRIRHRDFEE